MLERVSHDSEIRATGATELTQLSFFRTARWAIHGGSSSTHRRQDSDFAVLRQLRVQQFFATDILAFDKQVNVHANLATFGYYAIAQARMDLPQPIERLTDS